MKQDLNSFQIAALIAVAEKVIYEHPNFVTEDVRRLLLSAVDQYKINNNRIKI